MTSWAHPKLQVGVDFLVDCPPQPRCLVRPALDLSKQGSSRYQVFKYAYQSYLTGYPMRLHSFGTVPSNIPAVGSPLGNDVASNHLWYRALGAYNGDPSGILLGVG